MAMCSDIFFVVCFVCLGPTLCWLVCGWCQCILVVVVFFFFFKQKTAYEMRISDWSSDVCSSDLFAPLDLGPDILVRTGHNVIGTAHHRNATGINAVIDGFTQPPVKALTTIMRLNGDRKSTRLNSSH